MTKLLPRNLDHIVLPVPSLELARARFAKLGFKVAPDGHHKFGSENACIYFANGTFVEPLAIGHRETVEANIDKGNVFLRRDMGYRFRNGNDGFSMLVFGDPDPKSQRKQIQKAGWETGKLGVVKRPGVNVRIAFGLDERSPDFSCFLCERPSGPPEFDSALTTHENGAVGIVGVTLHEHLPEDFQYYLQTMSGQREIRSHSFGMEFRLPNASLSVLNDDGIEEVYGVAPSARRGLVAIAYDVAVPDLDQTCRVLKEAEVEFSQKGNRVIVEPETGQGAIIAFVEIR